VDSIAVNRANWDERAPAHAASPDYAVEKFVADPAHLSQVVTFDRPRLGDIKGLRGVHLQCHIGTDTVSLARLGARMTGLDFSEAALVEARKLASSIDAEVDFVQSDVYGALDVLPAGQFDLVYTGVGAICWLPRITQWASVVAALLKPGGRLFIREGHPMMWSIDENSLDAWIVRYPYFETAEPLVFDEGGTYVATDATFVNTVSHSWSHGIGEIISALLAEGLRITMFEEHRTVPWQAFPGRMEVDEAGEWRLTAGSELMPLTYTLQAVREPG
jgi:SAM-dependent methyltransferase